MKKNPEWFDESKLRRIKFESNETGWAVDIGDGTFRLANTPLRGFDDPSEPQWGDLVRLKPDNGDDSWLEIIEKYNK